MIVFYLTYVFFEFMREMILIIRVKWKNRKMKRHRWLPKKHYPFLRIDRKIDSQSLRPSYEVTNQIDGTLNDIMKFIIGGADQSTATSLFWASRRPSCSCFPFS